MQVVCRDRNRLALEADIVGAALHGIENMCCLTGDDVTAGDEPEARRVFDLDSPQLLVDRRGRSRAAATSPAARSSPPPHLFIGAVENPGAPPLAYRAQRALKKARAGARFLQLQICFEPEQLEAFAAEAARHRASPSTPRSCRRSRSCARRRALRFIDAKVPGISVPADVIERVEAAADQQEAASSSPSSWPSTRWPSRACAACTSSASARTPGSPRSAGGSGSRRTPKGWSDGHGSPVPV